MKSHFLIAAPRSGSGKTTVARGLMALLTKKGYAVQPFKCGPDYIDTKFHKAACGRASINLDTFMATPEHVRELFFRYGSNADVCIVEGMMGLFDGYDRDRGSSSEIAQVLDIPVVLVVDARHAAYSMAAVLQGVVNFRKELRIAGVIFNKVGSAAHVAMLQQVCQELQIECFGCLPKSEGLEQDSRYLGLDFSNLSEAIFLTEQIEKHIKWEQLMSLSTEDNSNYRDYRANKSYTPQVLVARNAESFSFIYQESLDQWDNVEFFDPETDCPPPSHLSPLTTLYLPGGYPEKHLEALTRNEACREAIKDFAERGGRVIAECGGMMYLCKSIVTDDGEFPMCDVLPYTITARKADRRLSLGYRHFTLDGKEYRGHEFHYTQFLGATPPSVVQVYNARGLPVATPVFRCKNVLASYTHLYNI